MTEPVEGPRREPESVAAPEPVTTPQPATTSEPGEPSSVDAAAPEPAIPIRTYDLPTARRVVATGIGLAIASTGELRRASLYVGSLVLAALGPAVVVVMVAIGRYAEELEALLVGLMVGDPISGGDPGFAAAVLVVEALAIVGFALLIAISIDAQAIAIAILAGRAGDRPIRLPEAIVRARQVFWRLLGASIVVGLYVLVVQLVLTIVLAIAVGSPPGEPGTGLELLVSMLGTLATVPFAYAATGIVLGGVGVTESLRRSIHLFRAKPALALVVVLFTLVTAAIQVFAFGVGLELAVRAGEAMGLDVTAGGGSLVVATLLVLAVVTAFGSLLFTIAALVSAPQVAAFLGLTFYSAGLDEARVDGERPPGFRWVTRPMQIVLVVLSGLAIAGIVVLPAT